MNAIHTLYYKALAADDAYSEVVASLTGKDRWTLTPSEENIPAIREAFHFKLETYDAWERASRFTQES